MPSKIEKQTTKVEVKTLPKYYSSKLITRNQSNIKFKETDFNDLDSRHEDKAQDSGWIKTTTLKNQDYVELLDKTPNLKSEAS